MQQLNLIKCWSDFFGQEHHQNVNDNLGCILGTAPHTHDFFVMGMRSNS